jgi:hypothetical protein
VRRKQLISCFPDKQANPGYLGSLTFGQTGKLFCYTTNGGETLPQGSIEDVAEELSDYRDNPQHWNI